MTGFIQIKIKESNYSRQKWAIIISLQLQNNLDSKVNKWERKAA